MDTSKSSSNSGTSFHQKNKGLHIGPFGAAKLSTNSLRGSGEVGEGRSRQNSLQTREANQLPSSWFAASASSKNWSRFR